MSRKKQNGMGLKTAREAAQLSQARLAELSGVTPGTVWDIEHGKNKFPSHDKVARLIQVLRQHGLPSLSEHDVFGIPALPKR